MRSWIAWSLMLVGVGEAGAMGDEKWQYPAAPRSAMVDDYHGEKVADPYRPLEDLDAPATRAWIDAQNALTNAYLEGAQRRSEIRERLTALWNYERYTTPFEEGGRYFYGYNAGLQNQNVLYTTEAIGEPGRVLIDPNTLSKDGTVAVAGLSPSKDGAKLAYAVADAGSDWITWKVRDVASGEDSGDEVKWSKFSGAEWVPDGSGFFYGRFPEPQEGADLKAANFFQKLYFHKLGAPQAADVLVWKDDEHKDWQANAMVTDDGQYLVLTLGKGTDQKYRVLWRPLGDTGVEPRHLVGDFDQDYSFIDSEGSWLYFRTDLKAPRKRVIAIDVNHPEEAAWKEIVPESEETLEDVNRVGSKLIATYLKDAYTRVKVFDLNGKLERMVKLPGIGTASGFGGDRESTETFYAFTAFTRPTTIYRYDLATGESTVFKAPKVGFDPEAFETRQVFYTSKDGTRVPMFLVQRRGLKTGKETPCLLYGYGGFNIAITPSFSVTNLVWMEMGGVLAVANLRGGGEYGKDWHYAGTKLRKQNVFDDFIAAAEWLVGNGVTSTPKLAIEGRSNGGLLVGACLTQRPELFGAAVPGVGVLDMLRFHKFTIGWAWIDDYGSSDDTEQYKALKAYSPLHNARPGCYPPTLIMTADHDDRVFPAHSFKFAAALQAAQQCDNPVLIRVETRAGHGAGKPTAKIIEDAADKLAFLVRALKIEPAD